MLYASLVAKATEKIDALLARLEQSGADPQRLDALRRTQRFKRSWVDLAQTLVEIRRSASFQAWGYDDFYAYCTQELFLKRPTVDKLTMSFSTLQRLAPSVLQWDGVEREIPSYQAVDYFGRAMGQSGATIRAAAGKADVGGRAANDPAPVPPPPREVIKELRHAVFDEGQSVAELRRRFDPILHPKPAGAEQLEIIHRAVAAARKLAELLPDVDGLTDKRVAVTEKALGGLRQDLEDLAAPLREKLERTRKRTAKKVVRADGAAKGAKKAPPRPPKEAAGRG